MDLWNFRFTPLWYAVMHWPKCIIVTLKHLGVGDMSTIVLYIALSKGPREFWTCHCIVMLLCNQCFEILVMKLECFCLSIGYRCSLQLDFWGQYGHYVTWVYWEVPEATHLCTGSLGTRLAVHVRMSWWMQLEFAQISNGNKTMDIILKGEFDLSESCT